MKFYLKAKVAKVPMGKEWTDAFDDTIFIKSAKLEREIRDKWQNGCLK